MIRLVLVGILLLLSLSFFLHNQEQEVTLRYFFGQLSASTPIYKPILSAFAIGLLVASILSAPWHGLSGPALCLGGVGVGGIVYGFLTIVRALRQTDYKPVFEDWVWHNVLPLASYAAILVGAGTLRRDPSSALFIEGAAALLLLFIGIHNAWDTVTYLVMRGSSTPRSE